MLCVERPNNQRVKKFIPSKHRLKTEYINVLKKLDASGKVSNLMLKLCLLWSAFPGLAKPEFLIFKIAPHKNVVLVTNRRSENIAVRLKLVKQMVVNWGTILGNDSDHLGFTQKFRDERKHGHN